MGQVVARKKAGRSGIPLTHRHAGSPATFNLDFGCSSDAPGNQPKNVLPVTSQWSSTDNANGEAEPALGGRLASSSNYEEEIERKLAAILSKIDGVGSVEVMVTFST